MCSSSMRSARAASSARAPSGRACRPRSAIWVSSGAYGLRPARRCGDEGSVAPGELLRRSLGAGAAIELLGELTALWCKCLHGSHDRIAALEGEACPFLAPWRSLSCSEALPET